MTQQNRRCRTVISPEDDCRVFVQLLLFDLAHQPADHMINIAYTRVVRALHLLSLPHWHRIAHRRPVELAATLKKNTILSE